MIMSVRVRDRVMVRVSVRVRARVRVRVRVRVRANVRVRLSNQFNILPQAFLHSVCGQGRLYSYGKGGL